MKEARFPAAFRKPPMFSSPSDWCVTPLAPSVVVRAEHSLPNLSPEIETRIALHWQNALKDHPTLYNGRVFCADRVEADTITGHWSEYRRVLAQMREPGLYGPKILRPLAVVGLLHTADGIVIGQRSETSIYLPGYWQGAPAGNVESRNGEGDIDLAAQLRAECEEELGISSKECHVGECLLACEHPETHIVDIGMNVRIAMDFATLQERCHRLGNAEYQALKLLPATGGSSGTPTPLVPTLRAMLEQHS